MNLRPMQSCEAYRVQLMLYLDEELDDAEKRAFEAHLKDCPACREAFNRERWFLECVHRTRPLYVAADELRDRVTALVGTAESPCDTAPRRRRLFFWADPFRGVDHRYAAMALVLVFLILVGFWSVTATFKPQQTTMTFAEMAVDAHQRYLHGQLPLELSTDVPEQISTWFEGKVPFSLKLPNYQYTSGQAKLYRLEGARLVGFKNDYAAFVAYQMENRPISLAVTSSTVSVPSGGEEITSKGLVFHYDTLAGFKVITWSHRGLTYALVSDLEAGGQQSCLVCHQAEQDHNLIFEKVL